MKPNEIGHFPFRESSKDYPSMELSWIGTKENPEIKWVPRFKLLGIPPSIPAQSFNTDNCVFDLHAGSMTCYYAADVLIGEVKYIWLLGNGWSEAGFPFTDDTFDPENPYETGKGCYALLKGKARKNFLQLCKQDYLPTFNQCFTHLSDFVLIEDK